MNLFPKRETPPVDMDQLERDVGELAASYKQKPYTPPERYTPLQTIAHAITKLTWQDAERMGKAIQEKAKENKDGPLANLTGAIQEWAKDWESLNDV